MNKQYIQTKLGDLFKGMFDDIFEDKKTETFESESSDNPYTLTINDDLSFVFDSVSSNTTYYADTEQELVVAVRDCIKDFETWAASKPELPAAEIGKDYVWKQGPVTITANQTNTGAYTITRENRMVGSSTELSRFNGISHILRKIGMYPTTDIKFKKPSDALYIFLMNFESTRLAKDAVRDSLLWSHKMVSMFEGEQIKLPARFDGSHSGMLARQVKCYYDGEEIKGILLTLRTGVTAEVLTDQLGKIHVNKADIWI